MDAEGGPDFDADHQPATSRKIDDWAELIESLREEVLEDYDFDIEDQFLDLPPEAAAKLKRDTNILPDFFTAVPDDPKPDHHETR